MTLFLISIIQFFPRFKLIMESGLDIRVNRRELLSIELHSKYQDENQTTNIKLDFIKKILIWMGASFSACSIVFVAENTKSIIKSPNI